MSAPRQPYDDRPRGNETSGIPDYQGVRHRPADVRLRNRRHHGGQHRQRRNHRLQKGARSDSRQARHRLYGRRRHRLPCGGTDELRQRKGHPAASDAHVFDARGRFAQTARRRGRSSGRIRHRLHPQRVLPRGRQLYVRRLPQPNQEGPRGRLQTPCRAYHLHDGHGSRRVVGEHVARQRHRRNRPCTVHAGRDHLRRAERGDRTLSESIHPRFREHTWTASLRSWASAKPVASSGNTF